MVYISEEEYWFLSVIKQHLRAKVGRKGRNQEKFGISCPSAWAGNLSYENRMGNK